MVEAHEKHVKDARAKLEKETQLLKDKIAQLYEEIAIEKAISEETQKQVEEDTDEEIESLKKAFQENIEYEKHCQADLRIEHTKTRKERDNAIRNEALMREEASFAKHEKEYLQTELDRMKHTLLEKDGEIAKKYRDE